MISAKVDIWSAGGCILPNLITFVGVLMFQMLYGKKPFGNNLSQQKLLVEASRVIGKAELQFPTKPLVSREAKV